MARIHPETPADGTPTSELKVREALARLPDSWQVFHSVVWQSQRRGRPGDGEADFVLLHPAHGLIVLEVKGGSITVDEGVWRSTDRSGNRHPIKNPFEQALDSKYTLQRHLREVLEGVRVPICHAVVFPTGSVTSDIGLYGPRDLVLDGVDLSDPRRAIERVVRHWDAKASLTTAQCQNIARLLAPTTVIERRLRNQIAEAETKLIELTGQQIQTLQMARRLRRAVVRGGAGTGKTILAVERANQLVRDGFTTVLLCFNAPLGKELSAAAGGRFTAGTFHSYCGGLLRRAGCEVPDPASSWWDADVAYALVDAVSRLGDQPQAIVVDEGQDFRPSWFEGLAAVLDDPDDGPFYVFADSQQALYVPGWSLPGTWVPLELELNCRNTVPIARRVSALFNDETATLGAEGPEPRFVSCRATELVDGVCGVVLGLIDHDQLKPAQIVVLADDRRLVDDLRRRSIGDHVFVEPGRNGVAVETIHRFKGLECEVAIVALLHESMDDDGLLKLAYVGMSRGRSLLVVVGTKQLRGRLRW